MLQHKDDPSAIYKLQIIFGHSSPAITKRYIGILDDEIETAYMDLNLGLNTNNMENNNVIGMME